MSKVTVVALIKQDEKLLEACKEITDSKDRFEQKMEFIQKQAKTAFDEMKKFDEPFWDDIKERLKETGALTDYNDKTHSLSFTLESNAIELIEREEGDDVHPLARLLSRLF